MKSPARCVGLFCFLHRKTRRFPCGEWSKTIDYKAAVYNAYRLYTLFTAAGYKTTRSIPHRGISLLLKMLVNNLCLGGADNFRQSLQGSLLDAFH